MNENLFFDHALISYCSEQLVNQSRRAGFSIASRQNAGLDGVNLQLLLVCLYKLCFLMK